MAPRTKSGPPRKSRGVRMATASVHGFAEWEASAGQWRAMELAFGPAFRFGEADRECLTKHIAEYLQYEEFERQVPFADDCRQRLTSLEEASKAFFDVLSFVRGAIAIAKREPGRDPLPFADVIAS